MIGSIIAVCLAGLRAADTQEPNLENGGSPVILLPGYQHRSEKGVDSLVGRIWKRNGPDIGYDIGSNAGNQAQGHAKDVPKASALELNPKSYSGSVALTFDEAHDKMYVSIGHTANFEVDNVRSRRDVAEVMAMIYTYRQN